MSSFFDRGRYRHFSDILMTLLRDVSLRDQQTSKMCYWCKKDSESHTYASLEMLFLQVMVKEADEKSNTTKQRNSSSLLLQKTIYLKVLLQKVFEITTRSSRECLIVALHWIPHAMGNLWLIYLQPNLRSLWSLLDYFRSKFRTPFVVKPINKLFSITITSYCVSTSSCCFFLCFF